MNVQEQAEVKASVDDELEGVKLLGSKTDVTTTTNSFKATLSGLPKNTFKGFGICLGYTF